MLTINFNFSSCLKLTFAKAKLLKASFLPYYRLSFKEFS